jgi:hypothetical protein
MPKTRMWAAVTATAKSRVTGLVVWESNKLVSPANIVSCGPSRYAVASAICSSFHDR